MKLSALIVDDETLARQGVALWLEKEPDFEIVGECSNGAAALTSIVRLRPDLVFLDIQMPRMSGIEVLRSLPQNLHPAVIFLTAYDEYALAAFEVHAIDYLLKPIEESRFRASLDHARRLIGQEQTNNFNEQLQKLQHPENKAADQGPLDRFAYRHGKQLGFVPVEDIDWIEAAGDYAELHVGEKSHLIRESLNTLECQLPQAEFLRIHRSAIIRLDRIVRITALANRNGYLTLRNGTSLRFSRSYSRPLRDCLRNRKVTDA